MTNPKINIITAMTLDNEQTAKVASFKNYPLHVGGYAFRSQEGATLAYQAENMGNVDPNLALEHFHKAVDVDRQDNELVRNHFQKRSLGRIVAKTSGNSASA